ncbi:hypothetical protein GCM10022221_39910 [Actinocorallia aurea]
MRVLAGRYGLEEELGRGGMGVVHKGVDLELGRAVAVKVLPEQFTRQPGFLARFQREARVAAGVSHPHVAMVHDIGTEGETPYLVMEYIQGPTLADVAAAGPLDPARIAALAAQVLEALEHCHALGIVHRDIKPSNIMIDESGSRTRAKVMDFGIARLMSDTATRLTATGAVIGTLAYLSPEQADGREAAPASDLYSLGCVLYELLTGRPPFTGDSPAVVLVGHLQRTPDVVLRALAKPLDERYPSATAMLADVQELADARTTAPRAGTVAPGGPSGPTTLDPAPARHGAGQYTAPTFGLGVPLRHPAGFAAPVPAGPAAITPALIAAGALTAFAVTACLAFVFSARSSAEPFVYLGFLLLAVLAAATLLPQARVPAAAALGGTLPAWPIWIALNPDSDFGLLFSFLCALVMALTAGGIAVSGGLDRSVGRLALTVSAGCVALALYWATVDFEVLARFLDWTVASIWVIQLGFLVTNVPVLALAGFLRDGRAAALAYLGWAIAVPLYSYLLF